MRLHGTAMPAGRDQARCADGLARATRALLHHDWVPQDRDRGAPLRLVPFAARPGEPGRLAPEVVSAMNQRLTRPPLARARAAWPGKDRPARWLTVSMLALAVLAAAAAVVSFSAQYRMVLAAKGVTAVAALEAGIPDVAALIFATLGHRAGTARQARHPRPGAERRRRRHLGDDERPGGRARLAGPGDLGDAAGRLRPGVRHRHRRGPGLDDRPAAGHAASRWPTTMRRRWRSSAGCCCGCSASRSPQRPRSPGSAAGSSTSARSLPAAAPCPAAAPPSERQRPARAVAVPPAASRQPSAAPGARTKTARFLALVADRHGPLAAFPLGKVAPGQRRASARGRPASRRGPGRAAPPRPVAAQDGSARDDVLHLAHVGPAGPGRRCGGASARTAGCPGSASVTCGSGCTCGCIPAEGSATAFELWLRWGRLAAFRRSAPVPPVAHRLAAAGPPGRALTGDRPGAVRAPAAGPGRGARARSMAPPRTGKTGLLARIILRYPGPVVSTTTKHDVFELTSGIRVPRAARSTCSTRSRIGGVPSTFRWNPVGRAARIRRPRSAAPTGSRNAVSMTGTEDASFWSAQGVQLPARPAPRRSAGRRRHAAGTRWALGDAEPAEGILAQAGAGQWARNSPSCGSEAQKTAQTVRMVISRALAFMADPALAAVCPARRRRRLRHRGLPAPRAGPCT